MDREDIELLRTIKDRLDDYGLDYILEVNDLTPEEAILHLIKTWGLELPE